MVLSLYKSTHLTLQFGHGDDAVEIARGLNSAHCSSCAEDFERTLRRGE